MQFVHDKMQRMRELAVQAANGTNDNLDRAALQLEFGQLTSEINSVMGAMNFNGRTLFDGSIGVSWEYNLGVENVPYNTTISIDVKITIKREATCEPTGSADTEKIIKDRASMFRPRPSNPQPPRAHI